MMKDLRKVIIYLQRQGLTERATRELSIVMEMWYNLIWVPLT